MIKKHQKELETLRKRHQKEKMAIQKSQCMAIDKICKVGCMRKIKHQDIP